ncbi:hypothetical protein LJK88_48800 [Paenibacillus sp. P26]|nr:hypothetical protein LJK88_48800 [Paenibacillus sp. P26]
MSDTRHEDGDIPALRWARRIKRWFVFSFSCLLLFSAGTIVLLLFMRSQSAAGIQDDGGLGDLRRARGFD